MATNPHLNHFANIPEQNLLEDLTAEAIAYNGIDVQYLPRTLVAEDKIFGEDPSSAFNDAHEIEMQIDSIDQFGGEGDLVSKFGLEIRDTIDLLVSKKRFFDETGIVKPNEGDLVFFPLNEGLFEITFVEDEEPLYPRGKTHQYKITCQLFEYSQEDFNTGISDVDGIETAFENASDPSNDPFSSNQEFEDQDDDIIDFSESNPFGEY